MYIPFSIGFGTRKNRGNMLNQFSRTQLIFGREGMKKLAASRVAVFGIGGVGGHTAEALVRSGLGAIDLIDDDKVCVTNLNRQIFATHSTVGCCKVDAAEERLLDIAPKLIVRKYKCFYLPETASQFNFADYDYVVDAIDTVAGKLELIRQADKAGVPIISAMGAGNKVDPTAFKVTDIRKTKMCPLAKAVRKEMRRYGLKKLKVVYSEEIPLKPLEDMSISCRAHCVCPPDTRKCTVRREIPGSNAFVPAVAGLIIAGEVIKDLLQFDPKRRAGQTRDESPAEEVEKD